MAHLLRTGQFPTPETVAAEIALDVEEVGLLAFEEGLAAGVGSEMAAIAMADLANRADKSNAVLVGGRLTRASVSKTLVRIRRHLGLPLRCPNNARDGSKPKTPQTTSK